jgi:hypothetical protein
MIYFYVLLAISRAIFRDIPRNSMIISRLDYFITHGNGDGQRGNLQTAAVALR